MSEPAQGPLQIELVSDLGVVERLRERWDELADACAAGPFARPAHGLAWWRHLGRGHLLVGVVRDARGHLVALAPCTSGRWARCAWCAGWVSGRRAPSARRRPSGTDGRPAAPRPPPDRSARHPRSTPPIGHRRSDAPARRGVTG